MKLSLNLKRPATYVWALLTILLVVFYLGRFKELRHTYQPNGTDEFLYYLEAKNISAHHNYHTPITFDGVVSKIGSFGIHGWGYAVVDGWLGKIFNAQDPSVLISNCLLLLITLIIIFRFKELSLSERWLLSALLLSHHVILRYTFSFYQETLQFLFGFIMAYQLYCMYRKTDMPTRKELLWYVATVLLYTQFRYNGFLWIFGLTPLLQYKSLRWWVIGAIPLFFVYGLLSNALFVAPFPYPEAFNYVFADAIKTKPLGELIAWFWQHFVQNIRTFLFDHESTHKMIMRYTFLGLSCLSTWYAWKGKDRLLIAAAALSWVYFFSTAALQGAMYWEYDQRALAVLSCIHAFVLIRLNNFWWSSLTILASLYTFWMVKTECDFTIAQSQYINQSNPFNPADEATIANALAASEAPVVQIPLDLVLFNQPNKIIHFPLENSNGKPIGYFVNRGYYSPSVNIRPNYSLNPSTGSWSIHPL